MVKGRITSQLARQIGQLSNETIVAKKENLADEEVNLGQKRSLEDEKIINQQAVNQLKAQKEVWAKKRIQEIETKIEGLVEERRQQRLKRREEPPQEVQEKKIAEEQKKESLPEVSSKPKRGLFWGKRIKTAQQQAQPETVGKRVSG